MNNNRPINREDKISRISASSSEGNEGDPLLVAKIGRLESWNIANRLTNPVAVISTLCKRMLNNQHVDDIIRYNLEVILEESDKIEELIHEIRASAETGKGHFG
jgi:hypothetical protein